MKQQIFVNQQSLPPVLTIKVNKLVGGWLDPLNFLELLLFYQFVYMIFAALFILVFKSICNVWILELKKKIASNWFD